MLLQNNIQSQSINPSQSQQKNPQNKSVTKNSPKIPQPEFAKLLKYHGDTIPMLVFNPNNKQLISCSFDKNILIWDLTNLKKLPRIGYGHTSLINDISMAPNGTFFATASSDNTIRIWNNEEDYSSTNKNITSQILKKNDKPMKCIDISCDSRLITSGSDDKTVKLISIADKKLQANFQGHTNWVKTVRFSRDSILIASGSDDSTLKLWDTYKKKMVYDFKKGEHKGAINCVRFHPDNSCLATACYDSKIRIFDIRSKQLVQTYNEHKAPATCVSFHPSGNFLVSTSYDKNIKIYDLRIGETLFNLNAHESAVMSCCFSNFGDYLATGGFDSCIVLWKSNLENYLNINVNDILEKRAKNLAVLNDKKNNLQKLSVENYNASNLNLFNDNISEGLSSIFERMVSQIDLITNSFSNFDRRLSRMEDIVDEMNYEDQKNGIQ